MAMLEYNEILNRRFIVLDDAPYEVIDAHIFRMQQRKPQNKTKLKNLNDPLAEENRRVQVVNMENKTTASK